jgi:hypothetical protein
VRSGLAVLALVIVGAVASARLADVPLDDPVWWLTNEAPPRIRIEGPGDPLRGTVEARIVTEPASRTRILGVRLDDQVRTPAEDRIVIDTATLTDGQHRLEVVAHDTSRRQNLANTVWSFVADNTPPRLDLAVDPLEGPLEGGTMIVRIQPGEPVRDVRASVNGQVIVVQTDASGGLWWLHGISPDPPEEGVTVHLAASDAVGNVAQVERTWPVRRTTFPEDDLNFEPTPDELRAHADEDRRLGEIYRDAGGPKRWDGPFRVPVQGEVTTAFGTHRSYEYHPGMDFAAPLGAPVAAPANGVVVFVGSVPARGNIVILDHGAGVFSTYAHLQRQDVELGAMVKPGQTIGRVGSTGFSTGPHLHWEMWVDGANVDPREWTRRTFP